MTSTIERPARRLRAAATGLATLGLLASMALAVGGCGQPSGRSTAAEPTAAPVVEIDAKKLRSGLDLPFEHSWDLKLPHPVRRSWIGEQIPELVFFQLEETNEIYAVDTMSGRTRWVSIPLPKPIDLAPSVSRVRMRTQKANETVNDDRLWVVSDDVMYCIDAVYGQLIFRYQLPFSASSGPLAVGPDGNLRTYVGDWSGRLQTITYNSEKGFPYVLWQWNIGAPVTAAPVEREGLVYAGDHRGNMNCFYLDRAKAWSFKAGGAILGSADVRGRALFFGTNQNVFYALNRLSGEQGGSLYLNAAITRAPFHFQSEPNRVYVWTTDKDTRLSGLHAINTHSDNLELVNNPDSQGRPRKVEVERLSKAWFAPGFSNLVSSTPEHLYLTRDSDRTLVHAVNRVTGKVDWAWNLDEARKDDRKVAHVTQYVDPIDLNRSIFTADQAGRVTAYRLFGYKPKEAVLLASEPAAAAPAAADAEPDAPAAP